MYIPIEVVKYIYEYSTDIDIKIYFGFINKINLNKYKKIENTIKKKKPLINYSVYNYEMFYK